MSGLSVHATILRVPPARPGDLAWPLALAVTTIYMADGQLSETEFGDLMSMLGVLGADLPLIEQYMQAITQRLQLGGEVFGREAIAAVAQYAQGAELGEKMQLYRLLLAAVHADGNYSTAEMSTVSAFGEAMGFELGQQLLLVDRFTPELVEAQTS